VTTGIDSTRIDFAVNSAGNSGSIQIDGIDDADLSSIDLTFSISSPAISGTRVDIEAASVTATADSETFVYDAVASGTDVVGSDGDVTISGFDIDTDKIIVLGSGIASGYDLSRFEASALQDYVVDEINNKTVIYFAPDADGNSSTLTLDGVADTSKVLNIVFGGSIGDEAAPAPVEDAAPAPAEETPARRNSSSKKLQLKKLQPKKLQPKKLQPKKLQPKKLQPKKLQLKKLQPKKLQQRLTLL